MPSISLNNQIIEVSLSDLKSSDIDFEINLYFKNMDAKFDEINNSFSFQKPPGLSHLYIVLTDTIQFFKNKGWETSLDDTCQKLISKHSIAESNFEQAFEKGLAIKNSENITVDLPASFIRHLFDYQKKSVKHLSEVGNAANFSVPGSGKTTISYAAYSILKSKGVVEKLLVVAPRAAFVPWEEEFQGCFGYEPESIRLEGSRADDHILYDTRNKELILSTYQLPIFHPLALSQFLENYKVLMILDESHRIKNMEGVTANTLRDLAPSATRRFILSGTPMPNSWEDVWTQFNFLWPLSEILDKSFLFRDYTKLKNGLGKYAEKIYPLFARN